MPDEPNRNGTRDVVLICGSRTWTDREAVERRVSELSGGAIVIEGGADGADKMGRDAASGRGIFVAEMRVKGQHWKRYGKSAGHKRNAAMLALHPTLVIAFSLGTNGTQGTIDRARALGIPVEVIGRENAPTNGEGAPKQLDIGAA